jgi:hypothetical protein
MSAAAHSRSRTSAAACTRNQMSVATRSRIWTSVARIVCTRTNTIVYAGRSHQCECHAKVKTTWEACNYRERHVGDMQLKRTPCGSHTAELEM